MNRKIKFRAWDKENKNMIPFNEEEEFFPTVWEMKFITGGFNSIQYRNMADAEWVYGIDNVILMQYIGLKDKNGVEIYEGDIVNIANIYEQVNFGNKRTYEKMEVKYDKFGWLPFIEPGGIDCSFMYSNTDCEVIGNIYENPELL